MRRSTKENGQISNPCGLAKGTVDWAFKESVVIPEEAALKTKVRHWANTGKLWPERE